MQRWDLLRNIKLAYGIGGEERHPHFKKGRDENLECTWPPAPWLSNSFKMHDLASSLDPFSAFRIALSGKSPPHGLPWWRSGWESACQCRGHGFEPWSGKIPHAAEQLAPWATTTEPVRLEPVLRDKRCHDSEMPVHRDEEWPPLAATRESPRTEMKTQHSHW